MSTPAPATLRVTTARVIHSELTKLRTVPATVWSLLATVLLVVGFGGVYSLVRVTRPPVGEAVATFDPTAVSLGGVQLAQLAVGVLGVLFVTGEFATGSIRSSIAAVPRRLPILVGKTVAFTAVTLAVCVPATVAAFLVGQSILSAEDLQTSIGEPGTARAVIGSALYLVLVGLIGLALGALLRNTAGAITSLFGVLFGLQLLVELLPTAWADAAYKYLPSPAGLAVTLVQPDVDSLAPWTGIAVFCSYIIGLLALAAWSLRRRDIH